MKKYIYLVIIFISIFFSTITYGYELKEVVVHGKNKNTIKTATLSAPKAPKTDMKIGDKIKNVHKREQARKEAEKKAKEEAEIRQREMGIEIGCLGGKGKCGINIYKVLGIRKSNQNITVETFVEDIVLSATKFFGVLLSIVVFFSGFLYILSAAKGAESLQSKAKNGIIGGIVGLLLVSGGFAFVRFIQFLAQGGS
ncbi:MAG: hypothetical protein CR971_02635 [candidate division SR1 bacterium]|nr:MAG: hypothetical protein CR971_02635 [candidate division SR1 bacterium]